MARGGGYCGGGSGVAVIYSERRRTRRTRLSCPVCGCTKRVASGTLSLSLGCSQVRLTRVMERARMSYHERDCARGKITHRGVRKRTVNYQIVGNGK
eukprot:gene23768-biopygen10385